MHLPTRTKSTSSKKTMKKEKVYEGHGPVVALQHRSSGFGYRAGPTFHQKS